MSAVARPRNVLRDQLPDDIACDVRQTKIPAMRTVREFRVVDSQAVEERGVKIVHMNRVVDWVVPQLV